MSLFSMMVVEPAMLGGAWPVYLGAAVIAQAAPPIGTDEWLKVLLYIIGVVVLILTAVNQYKSAFGRKPSVDDDLMKLREQLQGLAPSDKVEALVASLATAATKAELAAITARLAEAASQNQLDDFKKDVTNQLKEFRSYLHEGVVHGIEGEIKALYVAMEQRAKESLGKEAFGDYRKHSDDDRKEIKESLKDLLTKIEKFGTDNYKARKEIHRTQNRHGEALSFIAGQHEKGAQIRGLLRSGGNEGSEE